MTAAAAAAAAAAATPAPPSPPPAVPDASAASLVPLDSQVADLPVLQYLGLHSTGEKAFDPRRVITAGGTVLASLSDTDVTYELYALVTGFPPPQGSLSFPEAVEAGATAGLAAAGSDAFGRLLSLSVVARCAVEVALSVGLLKADDEYVYLPVAAEIDAAKVSPAPATPPALADAGVAEEIQKQVAVQMAAAQIVATQAAQLAAGGGSGGSAAVPAKDPDREAIRQICSVQQRVEVSLVIQCWGRTRPAAVGESCVGLVVGGNGISLHNHDLTQAGDSPHYTRLHLPSALRGVPWRCGAFNATLTNVVGVWHAFYIALRGRGAARVKLFLALRVSCAAVFSMRFFTKVVGVSHALYINLCGRGSPRVNLFLAPRVLCATARFNAISLMMLVFRMLSVQIGAAEVRPAY